MSLKPGDTPIRNAMLDPFCGGKGWAESPLAVPFFADRFLESAKPGRLVLFLDRGEARVTIERKGPSLYWETVDGKLLKVTTALMRCGNLLYEAKNDEAIAEAARLFVAQNVNATLILGCEERPKIELVLKRFGQVLYV